MMFADPKATGIDPVLPVSRIVFACQGVITSPPDFCCMGYGVGPEGEAFSDTGVLDLSEIFGVAADYPADKEYDDELMLKNFNKACRSITTVLQQLATSVEFTALPKQGPVIFALSIIDHVNKVLCRIHQDGRFELPPK